jgi:hypothetical protein
MTATPSASFTRKTFTLVANVVGLTGYAGAGKSTAAQYLVERHGFTRLSFAAPLKKMLLTLDPYVSSDFDDQCYRVSEILDTHGETAAKKLFPEYRRLLQVLGTDCIRAVDENFWLNAAMGHIGDGKYVFDDVRFPNEAAAIADLNPLGLWNVGRNAVHAANGHSSEKHAGRMGENIWLFNGGQPDMLEQLYDQIDHAVELAFADHS